MKQKYNTMFLIALCRYMTIYSIIVKGHIKCIVRFKLYGNKTFVIHVP